MCNSYQLKHGILPCQTQWGVIEAVHDNRSYPGYLRFPMGIKNSPDILQQLINDVLGDIENVWAYLDDILIMTSGSYEEHLANLDKVLCRLHSTMLALPPMFTNPVSQLMPSSILATGSLAKVSNHNQRKWKRYNSWQLPKQNVN